MIDPEENQTVSAGGMTLRQAIDRRRFLEREGAPETFIPCQPRILLSPEKEARWGALEAGTIVSAGIVDQAHSTMVDTAGYQAAVVFVFNPPAHPPRETPETFHPWQCEKCDRYHFKLFPDEGCDHCLGENIARRLGLKGTAE